MSLCRRGINRGASAEPCGTPKLRTVWGQRRVAKFHIVCRSFWKRFHLNTKLVLGWRRRDLRCRKLQRCWGWLVGMEVIAKLHFTPLVSSVTLLLAVGPAELRPSRLMADYCHWLCLRVCCCSNGSGSRREQRIIDIVVNDSWLWVFYGGDCVIKSVG